MANSLNTITVDGVTYDAEQYAKDHPTTKKAGDELGKDAFLQLLVAQMKYQDPLDPQDNSEYIAELANFSSLEQMTNVAKNLENLSTIVNNIDTSVLVGQLSSMIGKAVNWEMSVTIPDSNGKSMTRNQTMAGMVQGVSLDNGTPTVIANVDGSIYKVQIADITRVFEVYDDSENQNLGTGEGNTNADLSQGADGESKTANANRKPTLMGTFTNPYSDIDTSLQNSGETTKTSSNSTIMGQFTYNYK